jgi:hypothetical protein
VSSVSGSLGKSGIRATIEVKHVYIPLVQRVEVIDKADYFRDVLRGLEQAFTQAGLKIEESNLQQVWKAHSMQFSLQV